MGSELDQKVVKMMQYLLLIILVIIGIGIMTFVIFALPIELLCLILFVLYGYEWSKNN